MVKQKYFECRDTIDGIISRHHLDSFRFCSDSPGSQSINLAGSNPDIDLLRVFTPFSRIVT